MKKILTLFALLISFGANAQKFEIEPYIVHNVVKSMGDEFIIKADTCKYISFTATLGEDSLSVQYSLYRDDNSLFETGYKNAPKSAIDIIKQDNVNISQLNMLLEAWHIEAIRQVTN